MSARAVAVAVAAGTFVDFECWDSVDTVEGACVHYGVVEAVIVAVARKDWSEFEEEEGAGD